MKLKHSLNLASALAALLLAGQAAAQLPSAPPPPAGFDDPIANAASGSDLMVAVWDDVAGVSLIQNLGFNFNEFTESLVTPEAGGQINFGTLLNFSSVFAGSQASNINYMVYANLQTGTGNGMRQLLVTRPGGTTAITAAALNGAVGVVSSFTNTEIRGIPAGCDSTPGVNPCVTNAVTDVGYAGAGGGNQLGPRFAQFLPSTAAAAGTVDTALNFFQLSSPGAVGSATSTQYGNSTGFASWLLSSAGSLIYSVPGGASVVPLPAAVWLLLSGLAGIGAVTRRRAA